MSIQILTDFKVNLIRFFDELVEQFPAEGDFVIIRILLNDKIPIHNVMTYFIQEILKDKPLITARDDTFFTEGKSLFGMLPDEQASTFKRIWRSPQLDKDDRLTIWRWTDLFVALSEKYKNSII